MLVSPVLGTLTAVAFVSSESSTSRANGFVAAIWLAVVVLGFIAVWQAIRAFQAGEGVRRMRPTTVASVSEGRVTLTGLAEPAWAVATSPIRATPCIWYHARADTGGKNSKKLLDETNAVPFVLNDGTGRILVLARRAQWDSGAGWVAGKAEADDSVARAEGLPSKMALLGAGRTLVDPPPPLRSFRAEAFANGFGHGEETRIDVGERVTVSGSAIRYSAARIKPGDGCEDGDLDLPGVYVIGAAPFTGLDVMAGSPDNVTARGRLHLVLAVLGVVAIWVGALGLVFVLQQQFG